MRNILFLLLMTALAGEGARRTFSADELKARFWYDLGPSEIDVSSYPEVYQQSYHVFTQTCSACHTPARAINAPITAREDWRRYVQRMHVKGKVRDGEGFFKEEGRLIVDFLVYDSAARKLKDKAGFDKKSEELKKLYQELVKERSRLLAEEGRKKARPQPMYTGENPKP